MGGFGETVEAMLANPNLSPLLTRERISPQYFFSYTFIRYPPSRFRTSSSSA